MRARLIQSAILVFMGISSIVAAISDSPLKHWSSLFEIPTPSFLKGAAYGDGSPTGVYRFSVNSSGNGYTLTPISGPIIADSGSCGFKKTSADVALLTLTNSFGWVIQNDIYFTGRNSGDIDSRVLSGAAGSQSGRFIVE